MESLKSKNQLLKIEKEKDEARFDEQLKKIIRLKLETIIRSLEKDITGLKHEIMERNYPRKIKK